VRGRGHWRGGWGGHVGRRGGGSWIGLGGRRRGRVLVRRWVRAMVGRSMA
jgi:hypothetical protein